MARPRDFFVWAHTPDDPNDLVRPPNLYLQKGWMEDTALQPSLENLNYMFNRLTAWFAYQSKMDIYNWIPGNTDPLYGLGPESLCYDPFNKWWVSVRANSAAPMLSADGLTWVAVGNATPATATNVAIDLKEGSGGLGNLCYIDRTNSDSNLSTDGGITWAAFTTPLTATADPIWLVHDVVHGQFLAGTSSDLIRSGLGETWILCDNESVFPPIRAAAIIRTGADAGRLVLGADSGAIYLTDDVTAEPIVWDTGVKEDAPGVVYSIAWDEYDSLLMLASGNGVMASEDGGENWTTVHTPASIGVGGGRGFVCIASNNEGVWYAAEEQAGYLMSLWCSEDRGVTWRRVKMQMWKRNDLYAPNALAYGGGRFVNIMGAVYENGVFVKYASYATLTGDPDATDVAGAFVPTGDGITGEAGYVEIQQDGVALAREHVLDVRGPGLVATASGGKTTLQLAETPGSIPSPGVFLVATVDTPLDGAGATTPTTLLPVTILQDGETSGSIHLSGIVSVYCVATPGNGAPYKPRIGSFRVDVQLSHEPDVIVDGGDAKTTGQLSYAIVVNPAGDLAIDPEDLAISLEIPDEDLPFANIKVTGVDNNGSASLRWESHWTGSRGTGPFVSQPPA